MAAGNWVVDIDVDPLAMRARRRRVMARIWVPILGVALTIAAILVIAVYANRADRRGALKLADDVLAALDGRIAEEVTSYFAIPTRALAEAESLAETEPAGEPRRALVEKFSIGAMKHIPQIADFLIADPQGNFMMIRRGDGRGIDTKVIENSPGRRRVIWTRRDAAGTEIGHDEDPSDTFDPRARPWYSGALGADGTFWTDVYVFYTANEPGITASTRYLSPEGEHFVVGVDIALENLSNFLADLKVGESGRAMIITGQGRIVAHPQREKIINHGSSGPVTARVDEIGDPVAMGAYDRFRVNGPGRTTITVDGKRYLTSLTPLEGIGREWLVLIIAPEKDFVAFVDRNNRIELIMSLAIVALAVLGAVLLVRQGLRADRAMRLALDRSGALARQSEMFQQLADSPELLEAVQDRAPSALTEAAVNAAGARRASLWCLAPDAKTLRCIDSFQREGSIHAAGFEFRRNELPALFNSLITGEEVDVADTSIDPNTAELHRLMLGPFGSRSLSVFPVRRRGRVAGAIWLEDPVELAGSRQFLRALATVAALRIDEGPQSNGDLASSGVTAAVMEPDEVRSHSADLARRVEADAVGEELYGQVSVLVLCIGDPIAQTSLAQSPELVDAAICAMQEVAAEQSVQYLKIVGCAIVGAAGFRPDDPTAAIRIANTAVAGRDRIAELFEMSGLAPEFRLGIDCGMAIGRYVGTTPRLFNLWGEAVQIAQTMASSAFPGTIQTSEAAYERLHDGFLFHPRGTFYLPAGVRAQTFVLGRRV